MCLQEKVMITIDLITGFLGSGKTTFLKEYAQYLMKKGLRIGILENDFGAINVDMLLLHELLGDQCGLEMIAGGCDKESHARRFKTKLIAMGMSGYDRVLVEPSGIYDVDEFFDVLREEPLEEWYEIGNVIAIVDAKLEPKFSKEADYLLASEVSHAGCVLLSHMDEAGEADVQETIDHLKCALEKIQCKRDLTGMILKKSAMQLTREDFLKLSSCGYAQASYQKMDLPDALGFDTLFFMEEKITKEQLQTAAEQILQDESCGRVFRIKGFLKDEKGAWTELNAINGEITMRPIEVGQEVLIVIGEGLCEAKIRSYLESA